MRIVVSGTHASGKSTLISDFAPRHPDFTVLPDPFDLIDDGWERRDAVLFAAQLRVSADRLGSEEYPGRIIAERGPLDFLAYLLALEELTGTSSSAELLERAARITTEALSRVDLLVILPLTAADPIGISADEDPELRSAMNDTLLDLIDDSELFGPRPKVTEIAGGRDERLRILESLVRDRNG